MVVGLLLALFFAHQLSRPLGRLVEFAKAIGQGDLQERNLVGGPVELSVLSSAMNAMARDLKENQLQLVATERLEREMEIARNVQLSILPKDLSIPGLKIAANMTTASEVGGDYYDVIQMGDKAWIGIGDVAGHGLPAGLVMVMLQSCVSALAREGVASSPARLVEKINTVIYENVRVRLGQKEHVTFSLLRYDGNGVFTVAGAHEDFIVVRAASRKCERIVVEGTWIGVLDDISGLLEDHTFKLDPGDLLILYTDGIIEARSDEKEQLDIDALERLIQLNFDLDVQEICDDVFSAVDAWKKTQQDDETLVVIRYEG
jgi:sigma-B regulation protein RsbU (phosphoserine phosphatase)